MMCRESNFLTSFKINLQYSLFLRLIFIFHDFKCKAYGSLALCPLVERRWGKRVARKHLGLTAAANPATSPRRPRAMK